MLSVVNVDKISFFCFVNYLIEPNKMSSIIIKAVFSLHQRSLGTRETSRSTPEYDQSRIFKLKYRHTPLYAVFFICNFAYVWVKIGIFLRTCPHICRHPWSFLYVNLIYASLIFYSFLSHITRSVRQYLKKLIRGIQLFLFSQGGGGTQREKNILNPWFLMGWFLQTI
jgi:hypothetical protein